MAEQIRTLVFLDENDNGLSNKLDQIDMSPKRPGDLNDTTVDVEMSITVKTARKYYHVNMIGHCIFCLRMIASNSEKILMTKKYSVQADRLQRVPCDVEYRKSPRSLLSTLNKVWNHLQNGGNWSWDDGNSGQHSEFESLPLICQFCATNLEAICELMCKLTAEMRKLASIIRDSKGGGVHSWRAELFQRALKDSPVEGRSIIDTLEFLGIPDISDKDNSSSVLSGNFSNACNSVLFQELMKQPEIILKPKVSITGSVSRYHLDTKKPSNSQPNSYEGNDDDDNDNIEHDDINDDPDYIKEEECSSFSEDSKFEDGPIGDNPPLVNLLLRESAVPAEINEQHKNVNQPNASAITLTTPTKNLTYTTAKDPISGKKLYSCIVDGCGKTFSTWTEGIKMHQLKKHNIGPNIVGKFSCDICSETFCDTHSLRQHMQDFHSKDRFMWQVCDLCKTKVSRKDLFEHVRSHVGEEYLLKCPNSGRCSSVFCTIEVLCRHLRWSKDCMNANPEASKKFLNTSNICEYCGEKLGNKLSLRNHINRCHENGAKELRCPIPSCRKRFGVRQSVILHIRSHTKKSEISGDAIQSCEVCKEKVKPEEIGEHLKNAHLISVVIKCFQCPFLFAARENLIDHLYEHRHIALFCDICGDTGATFFNHTHLRKHYFTVHQIGSKFLCEHCQGEFFSIRTLEEHQVKHYTTAAKKRGRDSNCPEVPDTISGKIFRCDECDDIEYKCKTSLTEHKIKAHGAELLSCQYCAQKFPTVYGRSRHEREHREAVPKKVFPCQVPGCGKQYSKRSHLKEHVSWTHDGQKSNVCEQCGKAYSSKGGLKSHLQSVHMGIRNHVCDVCGESFSSGTTLKRHNLIHTEDRPFACHLCGQTFRHKEVLKRHIQGHDRKGAEFKPNGPMKQVRKRVGMKKSHKSVKNQNSSNF